jgi:hypothetical protein
MAIKDFDYRFNLKDKNGIKAGIIGLILGAIVFYIVVWKINDKYQVFKYVVIGAQDK